MLSNSTYSLKNVRATLKTSMFSNFLNLGSIQVSNAVVMMLLYPLLTQKVGLEAFGQAMVANASAVLLGVIVNFGTSQSGIKETAIHRNDKAELSKIFYSILMLRSLLCLAVAGGIIAFHYSGFPISRYFLFAIPLVLAEILNPLFIYLGKESLTLFNASNLLAKILIIILVIFLIQGSKEAHWINFILGAVHFGIYLLLLIRIAIISQLRFILPSFTGFTEMMKSNFYLVGNNLSVQLQQSLMLLMLAKWGNNDWLGAYSLCDKITWSGRLLIISVSNSVYPKAASIFHSDPELFKLFKKKIRRMLFVVFTSFSIFLIAFAPPIVQLIAGQPNANATFLLRIMALLQVLAALNSFNVIELLIRGSNLYIFRIALILFVIAMVLSVSIAMSRNLFFLGLYTLIIELFALLMYEYVIYNDKVQITRANG
ncbi:lipopolysaccharide biosynthesis protein [Daejeonella sp.]|uniref:lipopolysaccharide biosynthesis protein n=1 Tax=Daejeonella sp. TaxID=2805397 RepID=UPI003983668F